MKIIDKSIGNDKKCWAEGDIIRAIYPDDPDKQFAYFLIVRLDDPSGTGNTYFFIVDLSDGGTSQKYPDIKTMQKENELLGSKIVKAKMIIGDVDDEKKN